MSLPILRPALAIGLALVAGACSGYGDSRGYGYSRVSVGYSDGYPGRYGNGYYGDRYYDGYYGDSADSGYYGWYGDYYYPGVGIYLYDRSGHGRRWNDRERGYWEGRRGRDHDYRENWSGYRDNRGRDYRDYDHRDRDRRDRHR